VLTNEAAVRVFDVGRLSTGAPYVVMEHVRGDDLASVVASQGPFSAVQAIDLVLAACGAVREAHGRGIVHRAIEPKNLFLLDDTSRTRLKVLDFGLAQVGTTPISDRSEPRVIIARASAFNAPEHFAEIDVGVRADIWSLGATLHFLVSGRPPFEGKRTFPAPLERVIAKCMRPNEDERYASVKELMRALQTAKRELATIRSTSNRVPSPVVVEKQRTFDPTGTRRSTIALATVCGFVVLLACLTAFALGTRVLATSKRVAVTTSTSPSLFARP
jgi:serine/threonine protein kinase